MSFLGRRLVVGLGLFVIAIGFLTSAKVEAAEGAAGGAGPYVWIEGEKPTSTNVPANLHGWGHTEFLSDGNWLTYSLGPEQVPADGVLITYNFTAPADGKYNVWNRVAFDSIRSPFAWRIDGGNWTEIPHNADTVDLMELDFFCEVSWLDMGQAQLTKGDHKLEIKAMPTTDAKGKAGRLIYGSDAMCLIQGDWTPFSKFKPDENYQTSADVAAGKVVYDLPDAAGPADRASVELKGTWEFSRAPEHFDEPKKVAQPMTADDLPADPHWVAIKVPSDKNDRPDLLMAHTFVYRTHVNIPASAAGRSFFITFPENNLNTTVFCNGVYCGFNKNPLAPFSIDITKGVKPGQTNEIEVGMRDVWYAYQFDVKDPNWHTHFCLPIRLMNTGFQAMIYPVWSYTQSGITQTPTLTSAGPAYVTDVFVIPSVSKKELSAQVTVDNPSDHPEQGQLVCQVLDEKTGKVEKSMPIKDFSLNAGEEQEVDLSDAWANPTLWWPDDPHLYIYRTAVQVGGKTVDSFDQPFGFREWTLDGIHFKLNGIIFHGWEDEHQASSPAEWLAQFHKYHDTTMRFWHDSWLGLNAQQALNFFDENGVPVRRSEKLDGEAAGYAFAGDLVPELMPNWRDQLIQEIRSERNHPSIMIWSLENEYLYVNLVLFGQCDRCEPMLAPVFAAIEKFDPTRPVMTDGGGALKSQVLPVHGTHYMDGPLNEYPALAYDEQVTAGGRGRWVWDMKRPRFIGEDWFLTGNHPELSQIGGEAALGGKTASLPAVGRILDICQQGYRWADFGAWAFWQGQNDTSGEEYNAFSPRAALCRQWDWTFGSGAKVQRTIGVFNDTHYDDPITFSWSLVFDGKQVAGDSSQHSVTPGTKQVVDITVPMPTVDARKEGQLILTLTVGGKQVFTDTKDVSVLPAIAVSDGNADKPAGSNVLAKTDAAKLLVYDPAGTAIAFLKQRNVAYTELPDLKTLPATGKVLLIGKDALSNEDSTSTRFAVWAQPGRSVIALEQSNPLKYQALPADVEPAKNVGRIAFLEDTDSPIAKNLQQKDFFTWGADEVVYRNAYEKPVQGARSLIECDAMLRYSALVDVPVGKGQMLLSQLALEEKLADNAVAQQLLTNMLNDGESYSLQTYPVTLTTPAGSQFGAAAAAIGLQYSSVDDPLAAIAEPAKKIALITASPENLAKLADNQAKVDAFTSAGGWIIFNDLTPAGLASYNKIVGVDHIIRPYGGTPSNTNHGPLGVERITFSEPRNPLTSGMTLGDVVQYSGTPIFGFTSGNFVSADEFSYIVDYDEVAPFAKSPFPNYGNITNGFTNADGWPLIINAGLAKPGDTDIDAHPFDIVINLAQPETVKEFTFIGNSNYYSVTKINLLFDGKKDDMASFDVHSDSTPNVLEINPPRKASSITLQLAAWDSKPNSAPNWGIDNIYIKVDRSPDFLAKVKPMLNIGGMMEYPRGAGGIVLCNLLFKANEQVPVNMQKKRAILADLLRNLSAPFAAKTVIVGAHLDYAPIDISKQANQYRTDRGWFGNRNLTFTDLPTGKQDFAGVSYDIYDFPTSPVPTCIMLGGKNVPNNPPEAVKGIPVNRKADALFFLQTARIDQPMSAQDVQQNKKFELFKYVIHYSDGQTAEVPVIEGRDVGNYVENGPQSLPGAALAWSAPFGRSPQSAAAWTMQWNNPRPDVEIQSIDMVYGHDRRAVPVLLAVTAATAQ